MLTYDRRPPILRERDPVPVARDALIATLAAIRPLSVRHDGFTADELSGAYESINAAAVAFDHLVAAVVADLQGHGVGISERPADCTYTAGGIDEVLFQPVTKMVDELRSGSDPFRVAAE